MASLTRHLVDLEGFQVLNQRRYQKVVVERRLMAAFVIIAVLSVVCLFVCVLTTSWIIVDHFHSGNMTRFHIGIWAEYRTDYCNNSKIKSNFIKHFPTTPKENRRLSNPDLLHYYRTQAVFSVITFALMITSISFALYSFEHHRYMFKRLTAGLFVFVSMCILIVIEVLLYSIREWGPMHDIPTVEVGDQTTPSIANNAVPSTKDNGDVGSDDHAPVLPSFTDGGHHQPDYFANLKFGYSIYLAWLIFGTYLIGAFIFLVAGRKQKGNQAATEEFEVEDRPINLGRF